VWGRSGGVFVVRSRGRGARAASAPAPAPVDVGAGGRRHRHPRHRQPVTAASESSVGRHSIYPSHRGEPDVKLHLAPPDIHRSATTPGHVDFFNVRHACEMPPRQGCIGSIASSTLVLLPLFPRHLALPVSPWDRAYPGWNAATACQASRCSSAASSSAPPLRLSPLAPPARCRCPPSLARSGAGGAPIDGCRLSPSPEKSATHRPCHAV